MTDQQIKCGLKLVFKIKRFKIVQLSQNKPYHHYLEKVRRCKWVNLSQLVKYGGTTQCHSLYVTRSVLMKISRQKIRVNTLLPHIKN